MNYRVTKRRIDDPHNIHSLYYEVIAKARVRLLKLIERLSSFPDIQICYCNIDSIHISIPTDSEPDFKKQTSNLIGVKLGDLKIEAIGRKGIWLEPGRYWIYDEHNNIVKHANIGFTQSNDNFQIRETSKYLFQSPSYCIPLTRGIDLRSAVRIRGEVTAQEPGIDILNRWPISTIKENIRNSLIHRQNGWQVIERLHFPITDRLTNLSKYSNQ